MAVRLLAIVVAFCCIFVVNVSSTMVVHEHHNTNHHHNTIPNLTLNSLNATLSNPSTNATWRFELLFSSTTHLKYPLALFPTYPIYTPRPTYHTLGTIQMLHLNEHQQIYHGVLALDHVSPEDFRRIISDQARNKYNPGVGLGLLLEDGRIITWMCTPQMRVISNGSEAYSSAPVKCQVLAIIDEGREIIKGLIMM